MDKTDERMVATINLPDGWAKIQGLLGRMIKAGRERGSGLGDQIEALVREMLIEGGCLTDAGVPHRSEARAVHQA